MSKLDFTAPEEKKLIEQIFRNATDSLSEDDRQLPQVNNILPLLKRGVGIHHGGLLPILKEVIEILFQEGLLKVLFSTETFSMGLNMPARTVVFTSVSKFDGQNMRPISSGRVAEGGAAWRGVRGSGQSERGLGESGEEVCVGEQRDFGGCRAGQAMAAEVRQGQCRVKLTRFLLVS